MWVVISKVLGACHGNKMFFIICLSVTHESFKTSNFGQCNQNRLRMHELGQNDWGGVVSVFGDTVSEDKSRYCSTNLICIC